MYIRYIQRFVESLGDRIRDISNISIKRGIVVLERQRFLSEGASPPFSPPVYGSGWSNPSRGALSAGGTSSFTSLV